jgi:L-seryl-tRNA(Ser) seleniumtransferase
VNIVRTGRTLDAVSAAEERRLRALPSVEEIASSLDGFAQPAAARAARAEIAAVRERILAGEDLDPDRAGIAAAAARRATEEPRGLRRVVNATGVVLHTNLGRAPLAPEAREAVAEASAGYSDLELDLASGDRGSRHHHVEALIRDLTGAEAAIAVNNNAGAVLLALAATAHGCEVIVSRGELVEIGGSFRIPEILEQSGVRLVEVGTTNRTRLDDYAAAIGQGSAAILRVHQSNFRTVGFTEAAATDELARLASDRGLALVCDLGSGALDPIADEPVVRAEVTAGADIVTFSADKLLGGPQAGILTGRGEAIRACRTHPLARALRLDKLQLAALRATLLLHRDGRGGEIPALGMLAASEAELATRAERLAAGIGAGAAIERSAGRAGGGTLPTIELAGSVCVLNPGEAGADALLARLREGEPPVIARIEDGRVILDPRTMSDAEVDPCAALVRSILDGG